MATSDLSPELEPANHEDDAQQANFHSGFRDVIDAHPTELHEGFRQRSRDRRIDALAVLNDAHRYIKARFSREERPMPINEQLRIKEAFLAGYILHIAETESADLEKLVETDSSTGQNAA